MLTTVLSFVDFDLALASGVVIIAAILSGYTGFGGALFMVPLFTVLFGPVEGIAIGFIVSFFGRIQLYPSAAQIVRWKEIFPFSVALVVTTPFATLILFTVDPEIIRRAIGGLVVLAAILLMAGAVYRGSRGWFTSGIFGAVCGVITGAAGMGGPVLVAYFISAPEPPKIQRANIIISVAILTLILTITFALNNGIGSSTIIRTTLLFPMMIFGTWIGNWVFKVAPAAHFKYIAQGVLILTGIAVLVL
jgi:uncharacterized protein